MWHELGLTSVTRVYMRKEERGGLVFPFVDWPSAGLFCSTIGLYECRRIFPLADWLTDGMLQTNHWRGNMARAES